jgi:hypothetical protein
MDFFVIEPSYQPLFHQLGLDDCARTIHFFAQTQNTPFKKTWIKPVLLGAGEDSVPMFYKQYSFLKPSWKFWGRFSKARREFENYAVFQRLNIASAQRIACGEQRDGLGRLKRAFIVTRAVPDSMTLLEFMPKHGSDRANAESKKMRKTIINQLARMTRQIHEVNFFHNDLFWRNILVQSISGAEPKLWWIDCPRGKFSGVAFFHRHRRLKDLAALDKSAEEHFSPRERVQFMKIYMGQMRLNAEARRLIQDVIAYRKKRWDEK